MKKLIIFWSVLALTACFDTNEINTVISHKVTFEHKGSKTGKPEKNTLIELRSHSLNTSDIGFYMDVVSVYCGENICKVDPVRLNWDRLGFYHSFSLKGKVELEKAHGKDFTAADYQKLEIILANKTSGLALLHPNELVQETPSGNAFDALSGATVALLIDDYVDGAIWTCYTLWHFANGELTTIIRNITGDSLSVAKLNSLLLTGAKKEQLFAIEQLTRKNSHAPTTIENVLKQASINEKGYDNQSLTHTAIINYVNTLPEDAYFRAINSLIKSNVDGIILLSLKSLEKTPHHAGHAFYLSISEYAPRLTSYQQIDLLLTIIDNNTGISELLINNIYPLLKHQRFAVARSAYWFLKEQQFNHPKLISDEVAKELVTFFNNNKEKL